MADLNVIPIRSPIPESLYPALAVLLLTLGLMATASFFVYEVTTSRLSRSLGKELAVSAVASLCLGFGSLFLLLCMGVYV